MTDRRYTLQGTVFVAYSPAQAMLATLTATSDAAINRHPTASETVTFALFSVLTESQQDRVLQALGWQLVPPPPVEAAPPSP